MSINTEMWKWRSGPPISVSVQQETWLATITGKKVTVHPAVCQGVRASLLLLTLPWWGEDGGSTVETGTQRGCIRSPGWDAIPKVKLSVKILSFLWCLNELDEMNTLKSLGYVQLYYKNSNKTGHYYNISITWCTGNSKTGIYSGNQCIIQRSHYIHQF